MIVGRGPGGQPVHDRRLGAATSVPPLPERQRDAPGQFAVERSARARNPGETAGGTASSCGRSTSPAQGRRASWSATIGPVGVVRQNADNAPARRCTATRSTLSPRAGW
jgi:hypothetical protein